MSFFMNRNNNVVVWASSIFLAICLAAAAFFFSKDNLVAGLISLVLPLVMVFFGIIFTYPVFGFISVLFANYFALGISRYVPGQLGLSIDGLLLISWIAVLFSQFRQKVEWKKAGNVLTVLTIIWFLYSVFQFFNPEAVSKEAWFYAMRGVSLYFLLTVPLVFVLFNKPENLQRFYSLWAWFTILAVLKGLMQKYIGPDPWEKHWLDVIGGKTHLLPGGLRVFSFFSDSATYGCSMGLSSVVFMILAIHIKVRRKKYFYFFISFFALIAMFISGTRGALAVPLAGFTLYFLLSKRIKILLIGGATITIFFVLLKFTTVGNSNSEIRRFRGGLDSKNDSYQVRVENRKLFRNYLKTRPFGGGIGSAGNWGLRFTPGTFLAETPPDGWYIQIWAEQGIVGLLLYLGILAFILFKCAYLLMFKLKNEYYRAFAMAITAGFFGIIVASYSSSALGQMPNSIILFTGISFVFLMQQWEKETARLTN